MCFVRNFDCSLLILHPILHYIKLWKIDHDLKRGQTAVKYGRLSPFLAMHLKGNVNKHNVARTAQALAQHNGRLIM